MKIAQPGIPHRVLLILLVILAAGVTARGDFLEIRRRAHVRTEPLSDAVRLHTVEPGETYPLGNNGAQENGYYLIELPSGDEGWVYRTLVRRFPGDPPADEPDGPIAGPSSADDLFQMEPTPGLSRAEALVIASWNIKWFGQDELDAYEFVTMADFIEDCDVVAIQELRGENALACIEAVVAEVNMRGRDYRFRVSAPTGYSQNPDSRKRHYIERFAYVWDADRLRLTGEPALAASPAINNPVFRQVPYVAGFETTGGDGFDFVILTLHTVYNASINFVRRDEIEWVTQWMVTPRDDGEENRIAIGDFNANPPKQRIAHRFFDQLIPDDTDFRVLMREPVEAGEEPVRTTTETLLHPANPQRYRTSPVYDHILVTHETAAAIPADPVSFGGGLIGVWDFEKERWWDDHGWMRQDVIGAISDHRPIWFKLRYDAPDDD